jgi:hypothetical protein
MDRKKEIYLIYVTSTNTVRSLLLARYWIYSSDDTSHYVLCKKESHRKHAIISAFGWNDLFYIFYNRAPKLSFTYWKSKGNNRTNAQELLHYEYIF